MIIDRQWAESGDHCRTTLIPLCHLPTEFGKIRVSLPHADGVAKVAITEDY